MQFQLPYSGLQWSDVSIVLGGLGYTILLTVLATVFGTAIGVVLGWLRESSTAASYLLAPYVDVTRSVPLIIQLILINSAFAAFGAPLEPLLVGVLTLSLYMGVLTSELARSGLQAVRREVRRAARSLGRRTGRNCA